MGGRIIAAARRLLDDDAASAAVRELTPAGSSDTAQAARLVTQRAAARGAPHTADVTRAADPQVAKKVARKSNGPNHGP
jgi:hypothetical protein